MILGIDTSCYTTSLALAEQGLLLAEKRRLLPVRQGSCGLRQSDAFFLHVKQLPELFRELLAENDHKITGVCVSAAPRAAEGSYMPVFCAGVSAAQLIAAQADVPLYTTTHQEGHLAAALYGSGLEAEEFLALHISGGTTELLRAVRRTGGFDTELLGTADLAAGQMVDRIGVALGLPFPAGRHLEQLARPGELKLPVSVRGTEISFSGPETAAQRAIEQGADKEALAYAVFDCIGRSLHKALTAAVKQTGIKEVLIAGGVASNGYVRSILEGARGYRAVFAARELASDNAVGAALLGAEKAAAAPQKT